MQPIENKIISRVYGNGRGWSFCKNDFIDLGSADAIDKALSRLTQSQRIRRIAHGLYDYPRFSDLLQKTLSPDIDQVANAYARKFSWRIEVSGDSALNLLGLSSQIPAQYLYLSDGPSKSYDVMGVALNFKKSSLKDIGFKHRESTLIVQALKALGKEHLTTELFAKIREKIAKESFAKILRDTQGSTGWIYEAIKQICQDDPLEDTLNG
jgi:hypothetical protein